MNRFEPILRGNREALTTAAELIEIASAMPFDVKAVASFRHEMTRRVTQLVIEKSRMLVEPLRNCSNPELRAMAQRYTSETLKLRQYIAEHHGHWTIARMAADPREYRLALRTQLKRMQAHLEWEEAALIPAVASLLGGKTRLAAA